MGSQQNLLNSQTSIRGRNIISAMDSMENDSSIFENKFRFPSQNRLDLLENTARKRVDLQVVPGYSHENLDVHNEDHFLPLHPANLNSTNQFSPVSFHQDDNYCSWLCPRTHTNAVLAGQESQIQEENSTTRKDSDADSLDVYLKPCVLTPTKVEDLYSTLEEDDDVFQFPEPNLETPQNDLTLYEGKLCLNPSVVDELVNLCCCVNDQNMSNRDEIKDNHGNIPPMKESFPHLQTLTQCSHAIGGIITDTNLEIKRSALRHPNNKQFTFNSENIIHKDLATTLVYSKSNTNSSEGRGCVFAPKSKCEKPMLFTENMFSSMKIEGKNSLENHDGHHCLKIESPTVAANNETCDRCHCLRSSDHHNDNNDSNDRPGKLSRFGIHRKTSCSQKRFSSTTKGAAMAFEKPPQELKSVHNDTEKQRRDLLKTRFECLRKLIPNVERLPKAPKILVLSRAWEYIIQLQREGVKLEASKKAQKLRNKELLDKLQAILK